MYTVFYFWRINDDDIDFLFSNCYSAVKRYNAGSQLFALDFGVRQGSMLSPFLFEIYVDDLAKSCTLNWGFCMLMILF